ncbi:MAG TPA: restriction endonuclease subunit S [Balneolaceae bacterium]
MSEWKEYKLGEVLDFGNGKRKPKSEGEIPIYGGNGILGYSSENNYDGETIIIGRVGAYCGSVYYADEPVWISDNALSAKPKKNYDTKFLYYFLKDLNLNQFAGGSSHPLVTQTLLNSLEVCIVDDVDKQKAIASVLSSLDDKIDLLHRQNQTLEAMAETLFQQWFVEEAEEDWEEVSLHDAIDLVGGGTPKTSVDEYWNGNINWLSGGDIASNHKNFVTNTERLITQVGLQNSSARLLPKYSTVISARGTVGKYCLLSDEMAFSQSNYGIKPKFSECYFFTYLLIAHSVERLRSAAYGSVFDTITTKTFKNHAIQIPSEDDILTFEKEISSYFRKMLGNQQQIKILEKLRDTLLPKLMSGEVTINIKKRSYGKRGSNTAYISRST